MFKIVYVYIGEKKDSYRSMLEISLTSLRKHMPKIEVYIVTNESTISFLEEDTSSILHSAHTTILPINIPDLYTQVEKSRYLKTNLRSFITGDFIFLDCDTVICCDFSSAIIENSIGMVLDQHCVLSKRIDEIKIRKKAKNRGLNFDKVEEYFNSGVMLVRDDEEAHVFFKKWFETWENSRKPGMHEDQLSLGAVDAEYELISEIDHSWNLQVNTGGDFPILSYIYDAKIIHYFNSKNGNVYLLNDTNVLNSGLENDVIQNIIAKPQVALKKCQFFSLDSSEGAVTQSSNFHLLCWVHKRYNKIFKLMEVIPRFIWYIRVHIM